jgi:hypothetical protein
MQIRQDWPIKFSEAQYIALQGGSFEKLLQHPERLKTFREAIREVEQQAEPVACWDFFPIEQVMHDKLILAGNVRLGGGPVVSVVGGAAELMIAVCTAGPAIDRLIKAAQEQRQLFRMMILHDLGAWAVDMVRQELCHQLEQDLQQQGLRTSALLSPGESAWSVKDQAVIFSLLDASQIGVSLSPSMVMSPLKSLSLIMGTGPNPMGVEGASNCDFCTLKERCNYRHKRADYLYRG